MAPTIGAAVTCAPEKVEVATLPDTEPEVTVLRVLAPDADEIKVEVMAAAVDEAPSSAHQWRGPTDPKDKG